MESQLLTLGLLAAAAYFGWGYIKPLLPTSLPAFLKPQEGGDSSRTAAINGVLAARDYAHAQGKHDVCHALEQSLPGIVCDHPEDHKEPAK